MKHPQLKLFAIIAAIALWFYVAINSTYKIQYKMPIVIKNLDPKLALDTPIPKYIKVELEGKARDLIYYKEDYGEVEVDFQDAVLGTKLYHLSLYSYNNPHKGSIKLNQFLANPIFTVEFNTRIHKKVPVKNFADISPKENFVIVGQPTIVPQQVKISGSRNQITKKFDIKTETIIISELTKDTTVLLKLLPINNITLEQDYVELKINVQPLKQLELKNIPVKLIGLYDRSKYFLNDSYINLNISAGENVVKNIQKENITIFIEFSRFSIEGKELKPSVNIPYPITSFLLDNKSFRLDSNVVEISAPAENLEELK